MNSKIKQAFQGALFIAGLMTGVAQAQTVHPQEPAYYDDYCHYDDDQDGLYNCEDPCPDYSRYWEGSAGYCTGTPSQTNPVNHPVPNAGSSGDQLIDLHQVQKPDWISQDEWEVLIHEIDMAGGITESEWNDFMDFVEEMQREFDDSGAHDDCSFDDRDQEECTFTLPSYTTSDGTTIRSREISNANDDVLRTAHDIKVGCTLATGAVTPEHFSLGLLGLGSGLLGLARRFIRKLK